MEKQETAGEEHHVSSVARNLPLGSTKINQNKIVHVDVCEGFYKGFQGIKYST